MVEPGSGNYKASNKLANVVTPDEPQYAAVLRGENVPPEPVNAQPRKVEAAVTAPAWAAQAPAAAQVPWTAQASPVPAATPAPAAAPASSATPAWLKG